MGGSVRVGGLGPIPGATLDNRLKGGDVGWAGQTLYWPCMRLGLWLRKGLRLRLRFRVRIRIRMRIRMRIRNRIASLGLVALGTLACACP